MSKIGRNDRCPSGAGIKFKKCLVEHPELRADSSPAEVWWVCRRWQTSNPPYDELLSALRKWQEVRPEKMEAFLNYLFELPPDSVNWLKVMRTIASVGYGEIASLYDRVVAHISTSAPSMLGDLHALAGEMLAAQAPERLPDLVRNLISLGEDRVTEDQVRRVYRIVERARLKQECDQLAEAFPGILRETQSEENLAETEAFGSMSSEQDDYRPMDEGGVDELGVYREMNDLALELMDEFQALEQPSVKDMDDFVGKLLELPHDATFWNEVIESLHRAGHPDMQGVFHRILSEISGTSSTQPAYLCWSAMECFVEDGKTELLPDVAAAFAELDLETYSPESLFHCIDYMIEYGFDAETLDLAEAFLPVLRQDTNLLPHALGELIELIFDLRIGQIIREEAAPEIESEELAMQLLEGVEEDMRRDVALRAVAALSKESPMDQAAFTRSAFDLVKGDSTANSKKREKAVCLFAALVFVADEQWRVRGSAPGCQLHGLRRLVKMVYTSAEEEDKGTGKSNLLDYMEPKGLERRIAGSSGDLVGLNAQKAAILIQAHRAFIDTCQRYGLISLADVNECSQELDRLTKILEGRRVSQE